MCDDLVINEDILFKVVSLLISLEQGLSEILHDNPNTKININEFALIVQDYMLQDVRKDSTEMKKTNIKYSKYNLVNAEIQKHRSDTVEVKSSIRHTWENVMSSATSLCSFLDDFDDLQDNSTKLELKAIKKARRDSKDLRNR